MAKQEIGYDLNTTFTGNDHGTAFTTLQGELLSNYMESPEQVITPVEEAIKIIPIRI